MRLLKKRRSKINLALQGGGAHGAFTWGVLDQLLSEEDIEFGWVAGTSAGAVNAVALAAGFAEGGREGARAKLRQVWEAVHKAGVPDLLKLNPFFYGLSKSTTVQHMASLWSPYDLNPLGLDPLRNLLVETIDFERIRAASPFELLIAATEVATGRPRNFRTKELSVEAVLASACLPTLHRTVEIEGIAYWDGGFSKNPDLLTLALESDCNDTLLVQLNPLIKKGVPTGAREIATATNRLTFNAPLMRDVEVITAVKESVPVRGYFGFRPRVEGPFAALARHRFHMVEAGRYTAGLPDDSKLKPDLGLLTYLHGAGCTQTLRWLGQNKSAIGKRSSVDLKARFLSPHAADAIEEDVAPPPAQIDVREANGPVA